MKQVRVERFGDRIRLFTPYYDGVSNDCKAVKNGRWDADGRFWHYPLSLDVCRRMREVFGARLVIGPDLTSWARTEVAKEKKIIQAGKAMDAELKVVPWVSKKMADRMKSRTYQRSGAAFIAARRRVGVADEVGLGKTLMSLAGVIEAFPESVVGQHLVVANVSALESVWYNEIREWWPDAEPFWMPQGRAKREKVLDKYMSTNDFSTRFLIINKEMLQVAVKDFCHECGTWLEEVQQSDEMIEQHFVGDNADKHKRRTKKEIVKQEWPELFTIPWKSVVLDEAHKTLSTGNRSATRKTQMAEGLTRLQYQSNAVRIAMTGTPFRGREERVWGILNWLEPEKYRGKWAWAERFLTVSDNGYGRTIGSLRPERKDEFDRMLDTTFLRRTRREVRPEMPGRDHQDHWVSMSPAQEKQYSQFQQEGVAKLERGEVESLGILAEITRLRQFAYGAWTLGDKDKMTPTSDSPKLALLKLLLEERGITEKGKEDFRLDGGYKYIIASQFTEVIDAIERDLNAVGIDTLKITGAVTGARRTAATKSFNEDPDGPRVLVLNTQAGGESLTLDAFCDEMFILDETFIADDQEQLEGRIDNRGDRVAQRVFHYIRTKDTIESSIAEQNLDQQEMQKTLLDKRRGVEVAIRLLKGE